MTVLSAEAGLVDACYAYDPAFVTGAGVVSLRMAKSARAGEPERLVAALELLGVPVAGRLEGNSRRGRRRHVLARRIRRRPWRRGYRTNAEAHLQLAAILAPEGVTVERFDLPHHEGPGHVMHLLSVVSPVAEDLALVPSRSRAVPAVGGALKARGICCAFSAIPTSSRRRAATHAVRARRRRHGGGLSAHVGAALLEQAGCEVHVYAAEELNKGDGGPTCLRVPCSRLSRLQ